jgi:hypothetical protein
MIEGVARGVTPIFALVVESREDRQEDDEE